LGETEISDLLEQTLSEEKEANDKLTEIAEASINEEALNEKDA
jgi:ferritin-like metal-binding protein YciE